MKHKLLHNLLLLALLLSWHIVISQTDSIFGQYCALPPNSKVSHERLIITTDSILTTDVVYNEYCCRRHGSKGHIISRNHNLFYQQDSIISPQLDGSQVDNSLNLEYGIRVDSVLVKQINYYQYTLNQAELVPIDVYQIENRKAIILRNKCYVSIDPNTILDYTDYAKIQSLCDQIKRK